ncbi:MAG TPA: B12-binding domain-containing radical SAM protein, partial [Spirochaetota bacterium]|nr:B12-binding domain-containing radical SAM protein [Spirochaetota bacterium]
VIEQFSRRGLQAVFVGIESFKANELEIYGKKTTVEMNIQAIKILEKYGVQCYSGIIVGQDWEKKDFDSLIRWLNSFKLPAAVNIQPITPMPGTGIYERWESKLIIPREEYQLWDMAHVTLQPEKMSVRKYYYNLMRAYYKSSARFGAHIFIIKKYGLIAYLRVLIGAIHISLQYIKLIVSFGSLWNFGNSEQNMNR